MSKNPIIGEVSDNILANAAMYTVTTIGKYGHTYIGYIVYKQEVFCKCSYKGGQALSRLGVRIWECELSYLPNAVVLDA